MAPSENGSTSKSAHEKTKKTSRWGWSSTRTGGNPQAPELASAPSRERTPSKEQRQDHHSNDETAGNEPMLERGIHQPKESFLAPTSEQPEQPQQPSYAEEMVASAPKPISQRKSSIANSKKGQDDPEVRISIIVDPDSGETVGTVTLLDNNSARLSYLAATEESNSVQDLQDIPCINEESPKSSEQVLENVHRSDDALDEEENSIPDTRQTLTPNAEDLHAETIEQEPDADHSLPADLYSHMTPREAAAEQKRLESWINWAIITGRNPAVWRQRRKIARKRAARRRVLQRRAVVYSQRFKDALLLREGHHSTHASFELLKGTA